MSKITLNRHPLRRIGELCLDIPVQLSYAHRHPLHALSKSLLFPTIQGDFEHKKKKGTRLINKKIEFNVIQHKSTINLNKII